MHSPVPLEPALAAFITSRLSIQVAASDGHGLASLVRAVGCRVSADRCRVTVLVSRSQAAPVLAVWDGAQLVSSVAQPGLQGYGGDICARPGGGFVVSCPRSDAVALFTPAAVWQSNQPHRDACALAAQAHQWWVSGADGVLTLAPSTSPRLVRGVATQAPIQFDNHCLPWASA